MSQQQSYQAQSCSRLTLWSSRNNLVGWVGSRDRMGGLKDSTAVSDQTFWCSWRKRDRSIWLGRSRERRWDSSRSRWSSGCRLCSDCVLVLEVQECDTRDKKAGGGDSYSRTTELPTTRLARDTESIGAAAGADGHAEGGGGGGAWHAALICCMTNV